MFCYTPDAHDLIYYQDTYARGLAESVPNATVRVLAPSDPTFPSEMRRAFEFLRTHGNRRYTSDTLMGVLNLADRNWNRTPAVPPAYLLTVEQPYSFDEDTEVKVGGTAGVMVQMNNGSGRAMMAVAQGYRRKGVARTLLAIHQSALGPASFWVAPNNAEAQHFLLSQGLQVVQMNSRGALRYTQPGSMDGEEE